MDADRGHRFFVAGGTLPPTSASYLERSADKALLESLLAGRFCYVLNSRQIGKSSLSVHTISRLEEEGIRTVFLDLTRIGGQNVSPEQWYSGLAFAIGRQLGLRREVADYWKANESVAPVQRLFDMLLDIALGPVSEGKSLVVFIDEIDTTRGLSFNPDEFFAAIRECFNRRVLEPAFERLTFCLLGVAIPSDLVRSRATTPFNIGERIVLEDFTLQELSAFAPHLGQNGEAIVSRVYFWTSGHPYLSQSICRAIAAFGEPPTYKVVDDIVRRELFDVKARESNINLADVANIALHHGDGEPGSDDHRADVLSVYKRILAGQEVVDDESNRAVVLLKLSGIVRSNGRHLTIRSRIYRHVFDKRWIDEHMPGQELRRERQSFRRGVLRTALVTGSMLLVVGSIAFLAWNSRMQAIKAEERLDYELYVSDMTSMRQFFESGETRRIETVLNRHENSPYRGFEWGYWLGRYHDAQEEYTLDYKAPGKRVEGHISTDGKRICIVDKLTQTASFINRTTRKLISTVKIDDARFVVPSQSRWIEIRPNHDRQYDVLDLMTGKILTIIGTRGHMVYWAMPVEHSDFIATGEGPLRGSGPLDINLWNVEQGKKVFSMPNPWSMSQANPWKSADLFNFSPNGRFIVRASGPLGPMPGGPEGATLGEATVLDLWTHKVIDRFPVDSTIEAGARGFQGNFLLFFSRNRAFIRDTSSHKSRDISLDVPGDWRLAGGAFSGTTLVAELDGGRSVIRDLLGEHPDITRGNTFALASGSTTGQYLASASSVRLYDAKSLSVAEVVANGSRVTHYSPGTLNLFSSGGTGILRVDDSNFTTVGSIPSLGDGSAYTYSGHWYKVRFSKQATDQLVDADAKQEPIRLPFAPTIWSCGHQSDSIALYSGDKRLVGYSGPQKKVLWRRPDVDGVSAMWVSPDGTRLFASTTDRSLAVFDMATGQTLGTLQSHNMGPLYVTFSHNGRRIFTSGGDGRSVMWDTKSLKKLMEFRGNDQEGLTSADLSPDGRRVVTTSRAGSWQLWDASNGVQLMDVRVSAAPLSSAVFCHDGKRIVTAGDDNQIRIWRTVDSDPTTYVPLAPRYLEGLHL